MGGVLAWVVAVERHSARNGRPSPLDFKSPVARRALEWAEWLVDQPNTRLLLNVNSAPGSAEHSRVQALLPRLLNTADAHSAAPAALHNAVDEITREPAAGDDTLLLLWIGHGVISNRRRFLLHEGAVDAANLRTWDLDTLLQRLRSKGAPMQQLGVFDSCAEYGSQRPGYEELSPPQRPVQNSQFFYFAATAGAAASANPFEPTLASLALGSLQGISWPPQAQDLDAQLQPQMRKLPSRPFRREWTSGSGDSWSSVNDGADEGGATEQQLRQHARISGATEVAFRHLWIEVARTGLTPKELALALREPQVGATPERHRGLEKLAKRLARKLPDSAAPQALLDAWQRVLRVEPWLNLTDDLCLTLPQWLEIARRVASPDGRQPPDFGEISELLLWMLNMAGRDKSKDALLSLLLLAARQAREAGGAARQSADALETQLAQNAELAARLPAVRQRLLPPSRPVVLCIELDLPVHPKPPAIVRHWIVRDDEVERMETPELDGDLGRQLNTLINAVQLKERAPVRIELLAPFLMLCGDAEWLTYSYPGSGDAGALPAGRKALDTLWPISMRWKDRMKDDNPEWQAGRWHARAPQVQCLVQPGSKLACRFDNDDDDATADGPVRGLLYLPPSPQFRTRHLAEFRDALLDGDPYMLWPQEDPADPQAFKAAVCAWLQHHGLADLPEALQKARGKRQLPPLVLFIDEPDRNHYKKLPPLQSVQSAAP